MLDAIRDHNCVCGGRGVAGGGGEGGGGGGAGEGGGSGDFTGILFDLQ